MKSFWIPILSEKIEDIESDWVKSKRELRSR